MDTLSISSANRYYHFCCHRGKVGLQNTFYEKAKGTSVTSEKALKILNSIKRNSKAASFITHPLVVVVSSFSVLSLGLTGIGVASKIPEPMIAAIVSVVSAVFVIIGSLAFGVFSSIVRDLQQVSYAYSSQAMEAENYIKQIKNLKAQGYSPRIQANLNQRNAYYF